jgi:hypothetical protein
MPKRPKNCETLGRTDILAQARYGTITPDGAEAAALARGWEPFERQPELPAFDPMQEPRWSIVMTVAWIAWRDVTLVRENCPGFRSNCTHWVFREWNESVKGGAEFVGRAGWFLESWSEATTVRLSVLETFWQAKNKLPATTQMQTIAAEEALWRALSEGHLIAEALNEDGKPIDIPQREWAYLKLFEEGKRDALKYDALDRSQPFREVKLKRSDILTLWPMPPARTQAIDENKIEPMMIEPIASRSPEGGYVPLCSALHWIITNGGIKTVALDDKKAWQAGCKVLFSLIHTGEIELVGLPRTGGLAEKIPGHQTALVKVHGPLDRSIEMILLGAPSHISCAPYIDHDHWSKHFNDQLYIQNQASPAWTHLEVRKDQVLRHWPRPQSKTKPENDCFVWLLDLMRQSPDVRPKPKAALCEEARLKFAPLARRQFQRAWDKALGESTRKDWSRSGRTPKNSIHHGK